MEREKEGRVILIGGENRRREEGGEGINKGVGGYDRDMRSSIRGKNVQKKRVLFEL